MPPPVSHHDYAEFARAFPFHLVISPRLTIDGAGAGLVRLDPDLSIGVPLEQYFSPLESDGVLSWSYLVASTQADLCLIHRSTQMELRGRIVVPEDGGSLIFLGSSWMDDPEQLADFGITFEQLQTRNRLTAPPPPGADTADLPVTPDSLAARCITLERCLRLNQGVAQCLAENNDANSALSQLIEVLPVSLRWPGATLWRKNAAGKVVAELTRPLRSSYADHAADISCRAFQSGGPVWSSNGCNGCGGLAIPINTDEGTIAVITCVSHSFEPEDDELVRQLYLSAGQLARYLSRLQQKERLNRLTSELSAIFQLSADGFVAFNDRDALNYLNPAFARMTGLERDDLRGISASEFEQRLAELLDPRQVDARASNGDQIVHLSKPRKAILQRSHRDARDIEGRPVGRFLYFRDITLETELLRANTDFLSNAAHELRTPMASIHGFVELLLKRDLPSDKQRTVLETVLGQSTRLIEIINDLLEVARFDARASRDLEVKAHALTPVVRSTVAELLIRNDTRVVELALPDDSNSPWVEIDRGRFVQALTNVLSNAYKYSPGGGSIELRLVERKQSESLWVGVAVRDHGIGMTKEELGQLFERFFRAHPSGAVPGTGLGMSMVKRIVDAHGGMVEVDSTPGVGTEVILWLPLKTPVLHAK